MADSLSKVKDIEELITEFRGDEVFRVPKDAKSLRLHFTVESSIQRNKYIDMPVSSGLWVVEQTPYIYEEYNMTTTVLRKRDTVLPSLQEEIKLGGVIDRVTDVTICACDKALLSFSLPSRTFHTLHELYFFGNEAIFLIFEHFSEKDRSARNILADLMTEEAKIANQNLPLRRANYSSDIPILIDNVTDKNIKEYTPRKKYSKEQLDQLRQRNSTLEVFSNSDVLLLLISNEEKRVIFDYNIEKADLAPFLRVLGSVFLLAYKIPNDQDFISLFREIKREVPAIAEAYRTIRDALEGMSSMREITHKNFLYLSPLLSYDNLVKAGKIAQKQFGKGGKSEDEDADESEDEGEGSSSSYHKRRED